jgi:hypothetical protein
MIQRGEFGGRKAGEHSVVHQEYTCECGQGKVWRYDGVRGDIM